MDEEDDDGLTKVMIMKMKIMMKMMTRTNQHGYFIQIVFSMIIMMII